MMEMGEKAIIAIIANNEIVLWYTALSNAGQTVWKWIKYSVV